MSDDVLNAALEYLDLGFSVVPVKRADKTTYIKWKEFQDRQPTPEEVERWWSIWPDANVAIITGSVSGIYCVDADGQAGIGWINEHLPKTSVYNLTAKGVHAIFRIPPGATIRNAVRLATEVDIRGEGGYFVAPPSRHQSGHRYEWRMLLNGWEDLESYAPGSNGYGHKNLNLDLSGVKASPINTPVAQGSRNSSLAQLVGQWIGKNLDDAEVEVLARQWNAGNSPPLGEQELLKTLESIRNTHLRNHPSVSLTDHLEPEDLTIRPECEISPTVLCPGGILQELMDYIDANSPVAVPLFSLAASVVFLGTIAGQRVMTETALRTNMYCISLGYSGSGKNAPFITLPQLLQRVDTNLNGPTELTSSTSILKWLSNENKRSCMMLLDEIGQVLKGLKNPNSFASDIPRTLTKLFSSTDRPELKTYAGGDSISFPWHHLSFYGASTPERFWESLTFGEVADGFLARVLIWESRHDSSLPKQNVSFEYPLSLIEKLQAIRNIKIEWDESKGNLVRTPIPKVIPKTTDALILFREFAKKYHDLKNRHKNDCFGVASIYGRAAEHASKLALIHAVSMRGGEVETVDAESLRWACETVSFLTERTVGQVNENIAETDVSRWKQKIVKGIREISRKKSYGGATIRDLMRGPCQGLGGRDLKAHLESLAMGEQIGVREDKTSQNRTYQIYYAARMGEEI